MEMKQKITVKDILENHYEDFKSEHWDKVPKNMREHIDKAVSKALKCSDIKYGFAEYKCEKCGESTKVPFTCKSKFCNKCGRLYAMKWAEKQRDNMLRVGHRHSVFTIPKELRKHFYSRRELLKELQDGVNEVINYWYNKNKGSKYEIGVIAVVHTFGGDLKWNPHVHALVTEGAIDKKIKWWKKVEYIPYPYLKRSWQKVLLDIIKKHFNSYETRNLISYLYKKYPKGFYVNAKRRLDDTTQAVKYIGRYLARAAIAEYRIIKYENNKVTFWYEDHNDGVKKKVECDVLDFIGKITQHIAPNGFRMVRRYGVYARVKNKIAKDIVHLYNFVKQRNINNLLKEKNKQNIIKKSWKERIIESFGDNPLLCKKCGTEKFLWTIWHRDYGVIYDIRETRNMEDILYEPKTNKVHRRVLQIPLFEM